jgi:hypothetical protein
VALINPVSDPYEGFYWDPLVIEAARELKPYPLPPPESAVVETSLAVYTVGVAELTGGSSLLLAGQPTASLSAFTLAPRVQLNVRLFDVAPDGTRQLVTRGTCLLLDSGGTADVIIEATVDPFEPPMPEDQCRAGDQVCRVPCEGTAAPQQDRADGARRQGP